MSDTEAAASARDVPRDAGPDAGADAGADAVRDAVRVEGVAKTYVTGAGRRRRRVEAVRDASFTIPAGSCLAVVGESGSGKTTLARMLLGLERPDAGAMTVNGVAVGGRAGRRERRRRSRDIQIVFQDPQSALNRRLPVRTAVTEVLAAHTDLDARGRSARCAELFEAVGLQPEHLDALPHELSGGQRQRVCIARALAPHPAVVVLDEAVSALDVTVQGQILALLERLRREHGLTYLFITHDLAVARQVADRIVVMRRGEIVEAGSAEQVLDDPQHPYTRNLLDSAPRPGWRPRRRRAEPTQGEPT